MLVALTGEGQTENVERIRWAGLDRHFTKPVDFGALETFVNDTDPPSADKYRYLAEILITV